MEGDRYRPVTTGIHICGFTPEDDNEHMTVRNYRFADLEKLYDNFDAIKAELDEGSDGDLLCDLFVGGSCLDSFWIRRQMLDRLATLAIA